MLAESLEVEAQTRFEREGDLDRAFGGIRWLPVDPCLCDTTMSVRVINWQSGDVRTLKSYMVV